MDWGAGGPERRRTCMLIITHACNLNCSYCYEAHKGNAYMDVSLAKEIISREAQFVSESDDFDEIDIDFMGGEPFMNFPLIKEVVEWLETGVISVPWICSATTNGTLLTDEIKKWLREHKDSFVPGASYDGTGKMQSTNRGTDKYNVDLDFFQETWPFQPLHMTISRETLPNLAEGVLDIQKKGYKVEGALAEGVDWTLEDAVLYRKQLCILKETYLNNTTLTPFNRLTMVLRQDLKQSKMRIFQHKMNICFPRKHLCHRVTSFDIASQIEPATYRRNDCVCARCYRTIRYTRIRDGAHARNP